MSIIDNLTTLITQSIKIIWWTKARLWNPYLLNFVTFGQLVFKDLMSYSTIFIDDKILVKLLLKNSRLGME